MVIITFAAGARITPCSASSFHRKDHKMKVIDKVKDYYLWVIDQIEAHPHIVFWAGSVALAAALYF